MAHIYVQIKTEDDPLTDVGRFVWETDFEVPERSVSSLKNLFERMKQFLADMKEGESHE